MTVMLIADVARLTNTTPATIRYYEALGLLTVPPRSQAGYRCYCEKTLEEIRFIKKGQGLGFSLNEIGEILKISRQGSAPCSHVLELAERNLAATDQRLHYLQAFRDRLAAQIDRWKRNLPLESCSAGGLCEIISSAELQEVGPAARRQRKAGADSSR